jgi:hypothetical protein
MFNYCYINLTEQVLCIPDSLMFEWWSKQNNVGRGGGGSVSGMGESFYQNRTLTQNFHYFKYIVVSIMSLHRSLFMRYGIK